MSIYNPLYRFTPIAKGTTYATLEAMDKSEAFNFIVNPETIKWQHQANHATLPVLWSGQPQTAYQNSNSIITIPTFYLWTPDSASTVSAAIATLKSFTKPRPTTNRPPLLTFTFGSTVVERVYLIGLEITEQQWRGGQVTQAEGSMSFLISGLPSEPTKKVAPKNTPRQKAKVTTPVKTPVKTPAKKPLPTPTKKPVPPSKTKPQVVVNKKGDVVRPR